MDADPERVDLQAPLPDGALSARVTFRAARLGIDRTVPRSAATHAEVERELLGGRSDKRRLDLAEADAYLAEAARFHADVERDDGARRERAETAREERERLAASLSSDCPRCGSVEWFRHGSIGHPLGGG